MSQAQAQKNYFTFAKGLVTEASPINGPDNSSTSEDNFDLVRNGTRMRRRGMDFEHGGSTPTISQTHAANYYTTGNHVVSNHSWRSIGGIGTNNKLIIQTGNLLHLRGLDTAIVSTGGAGITFDNTAIGGGASDTSIDLANVAVGGADTGLDKVQVAFGKGTAFVVGPNISPFYIEYHSATATYSTHYVGGAADNILIRDFNGVNDGLAVDNRPTYANWAALVAGNPNHAYNLLNQGWTQPHVETYISGTVPSTASISAIVLGGGTTTEMTVANNSALSNGASVTISGVVIPGGDPNINGVSIISNVTVGITNTTFTIPIDTTTAVGPYTGGEYNITIVGGVAPSNSDVWWYGKNSTGIFTPAEMDKLWFGSMYAAQGHYTHNAFTNTRSAIVAGATDFTTTARPSVTTFYSGRVWYSGIQDSEFSGTILFSKLVEGAAQDAHHCHMDADPTSEIVSGLIASDGGTITIPEAGQIIKLLPMPAGLLVVARNGLWQIKPSTDKGFSATGFAVNKVSNVGCESPDSVVEVEGSVMYFARAGIYLVSINPQSFLLSAQNITQSTIQSEIAKIGNDALPYVEGVYDPLEREVKFLYSTALDTFSMYKNKLLTSDLVLKAWYTGTLAGDNTSPFMVGGFKTLNISSVAPDYESMLRYVNMKPTSATTTEFYISALYDNRLVDWYTNDGVGKQYISSLDAVHELLGDAMRTKHVSEVHLFFKRTENTITNGVLDNPSSCFMQYRFDWADDASSGLYSKLEQAYKFNRPFTIPSGTGTFPFTYGQEVIVTKHSVRGGGRAIQLHVESDGANDIQLLGWAVMYTGNTR